MRELVALSVPVVLYLVNVFVKFYFKWVPDVDRQKRQIKKVSCWLLDIFMIGTGVLGVCFFAQISVLNMQQYVLKVSFVMSCTVLNITLILFRRYSSYIYGPSEQSGLGHTTSVVGLMKGQIKALCILSNDPNLAPETSHALKTLLYGEEGEVAEDDQR
jgi:hypothetical protein